MMNYSVTDAYSLRKLCIERDWFNAGTNDQYDKLFDANRDGGSLETIAAIIWVCTDTSETILEIKAVLEQERNRYRESVC